MEGLVWYLIATTITSQSTNVCDNVLDGSQGLAVVISWWMYVPQNITAKQFPQEYILSVTIAHMLWRFNHLQEECVRVGSSVQLPRQHFQFLQQTEESKWNSSRAFGSRGPSPQCRSQEAPAEGSWDAGTKPVGAMQAKVFFPKSSRGTWCHILPEMFSHVN